MNVRCIGIDWTPFRPSGKLVSKFKREERDVPFSKPREKKDREAIPVLASGTVLCDSVRWRR